MTDNEQHTGSLRADARSLTADALELLRRQAVTAVESGVPQLHVARMLGVSRKTVGTWVRAYRAGGEQAFRPRRRGRRPGEQLALSLAQQAWVLKTVAGSPPDEVGLPHRLWTRRAIAELIDREFGMALNTATIGQYLSRWGLVGRTNLLAHLRDSTVPTVPSPRGEGPRFGQAELLWVAWTRVCPPMGEERLNVLLAVTNRGMLFFLADGRPFDRPRLGDFQQRLRVQLGREVTMVVCSWPVDGFELLSAWIAECRDVVVRVTGS